MRRYDFILDGTLLDIDWQMVARSVSNTLLLNGENYIRSTLNHFGLSVLRFKSTAALMCCPTRGCSRSDCHVKALPSARALWQTCDALMSNRSVQLSEMAHSFRDDASTLGRGAALAKQSTPSKVVAEPGHEYTLVRSKDPGELYLAWRHAFAHILGARHMATNGAAASNLGLWLPELSRHTTLASGAARLSGPDCLRRLWEALGEDTSRRGLACTVSVEESKVFAGELVGGCNVV